MMRLYKSIALRGFGREEIGRICRHPSPPSAIVPAGATVTHRIWGSSVAQTGMEILIAASLEARVADKSAYARLPRIEMTRQP